MKHKVTTEEEEVIFDTREDYNTAPNPTSDQFAELKEIVQRAYEEGVTIPEAEKLAARFLVAQMSVAETLAVSDLDARMKKNGYKTMRAKVYLDEVQKAEKKPTEAALEALISTDKGVAQAQDLYERADVDAESLRRYFDIFRESHIYFRGVSRGKYE